jgi:hypothetical protein
MILYPGSLNDYEQAVENFGRVKSYEMAVSMNHLVVRSFTHLLALADGDVPEIWRYSADTPDRHVDATDAGLRLLRTYNQTGNCGDVSGLIENMQARFELGIILRDSSIDAVIEDMNRRIIEDMGGNP